MSWARRTDANHALIVRELAQAGFSVLDLSRVGQGCPDLLVGRAGAAILVEVKVRRGKTNAAQIAFAAAWRGPPVVVAHMTRDVLDAFDRLMIARRRQVCA